MGKSANDTLWVHEAAKVVAAAECPHFIPAADAEDGATRCDWCSEKAVPVFGQFGKSGPTNRRRTTKSDPAGKGYTKRERADAA